MHRGQKAGDQRSAGSEQESEKRGKAGDGPFEFSPELMARFEEVESLSPNDPSYAERLFAAVADGTKELRAHGSI